MRCGVSFGVLLDPPMHLVVFDMYDFDLVQDGRRWDFLDARLSINLVIATCYRGTWIVKHLNAAPACCTRMQSLRIIRGSVLCLCRLLQPQPLFPRNLSFRGTWHPRCYTSWRLHCSKEMRCYDKLQAPRKGGSQATVFWVLKHVEP